MKKQKAKHISEFKKGEFVTRIEPSRKSEYNKNLGIEFETPFDRSYMGDKLKYLGSVNGQILFERIKSKNSIDDLLPKNISLDYNEWQNGWTNYINPKSLIENPKDRMLNKNDSKKFLVEIVKNYSN